MVASSLYNLGMTFSSEALLPSCLSSMSVISFGYGVLGLSVIACLTLSGIGICSNANRVSGYNSPICFFSEA